MPFLLTCDLLSAQWHIEDSYTIFSRNFQGHCIQLLHLWSNENKEICGFRVLQNAATINNFPVDSRFKLFLPIQKISSFSVDYLGQENLVDKGRITSVKDLEIWQMANDQGLTLETSALQIFHGGNSTFINSFGKTKFSCFTLPLPQQFV